MSEELDPTPTNATSGDQGAAAPNPAGEGGTPTPTEPTGEHLLSGADPAAEPTEGDKAGEEPKGEAAEPPKPPEDFDLNIPEGFEASDEALSAFKGLAKELGLQQEQAQKLIDYQAEIAAKQLEADRKQWMETQKVWQTEVRQDAEFGGAEFDKNLALANRVLTKFGTPELLTFLQNTGLSNHPEMVKFAIRLGKAGAEDSVAGTSGSPTDPRANMTPHQRMADAFYKTHNHDAFGKKA